MQCDNYFFNVKRGTEGDYLRMVYDIAVIGAGVVGSLIARALSQYKLDIVLVEKTSDVAMGTTKANSGIVHAGFDAFSGTMKAKMNTAGVPLLYEAAEELIRVSKINITELELVTDLRTGGNLHQIDLLGIQEIVILQVRCYEGITAMGDSLGNIAAAGAAAHRNTVYRPSVVHVAQTVTS